MPVVAGDFWNISNPKKPRGDFDPNAKLRFALGVDDILTEMGTTYGSHVLIAQTPLEVLEAGTYAAGEVTPLIGATADALDMIGQTVTLTLRVIGADGQQDDRTMYLKFKHL